MLTDISDEFNGIVDKLFPSGIWPVVTQILATLLLVLIVYKLLYQPVKNMLAKRAEFIKNNVDGAAKSNKEAAVYLETAEKAVIDSKVTAQDILHTASEDADQARAAALAAASEEIRAMKVRAEEEIAESKRQALEDIHKEIVNVALAASRQVLAREINEKDNARLVDDFIKEVKN